MYWRKLSITPCAAHVNLIIPTKYMQLCKNPFEHNSLINTYSCMFIRTWGTNQITKHNIKTDNRAHVTLCSDRRKTAKTLISWFTIHSLAIQRERERETSWQCTAVARWWWNSFDLEIKCELSFEPISKNQPTNDMKWIINLESSEDPFLTNLYFLMLKTVSHFVFVLSL